MLQGIIIDVSVFGSTAIARFPAGLIAVRNVSLSSQKPERIAQVSPLGIAQVTA